MSDLFLEILEGPGKGGGYRLLADTALVGRGPDCDIRLDNVRGVSRNHCRLYVMDGTLRVQDLGSQNGVIINGKKISDVIIKPGVAMKIGEAVLALRRDDPTVIKSAIARTVDSGAAPGADPGVTALGAPAPVTAPPPAGLQPAPPPRAPAPALASSPRLPAAELSNIEQAQELMEAAGRSSKGILLGILVLVAIVFAGLYLVHLVSLSRQAPRNFIIVKAKEDKAVDLGVNCKQASVDCSEKVKRQLHGRQLGTVAPYRGLLSETLTKLYASNPNVPKRTIMVLKGDTEGEGWIALKDGNGAALLGKDGKPLRRRLICRGVVPRAFPESIAGAEAQQQAREQAMMLEAEGDVLLQDGRHYDAWQKFRLANDLYLAARVKDRSTSCNAKVIAARTQLAKQLQGTFVDAISMAFPVEARTGGPNFTQANILLDSAKTMIPDLNSVDRQVIEIWQVIVERAKEKHKAEKG